MASANLTQRMKHAIANEELSLEILKRVSVTSAPANAAAAQAVLASLDESKNEKIAEWCKVAFAGDGKAGDEIAKKVVKMMDVLKAKANGEEVAGSPSTPAVKAEFNAGLNVSSAPESFHFRAVTAGAAGNSIELFFDSVTDVSGIILAWNAANPTNQVELVSGNPATVVDGGEVAMLFGGADEVPGAAGQDTDLQPAKDAMGNEPMSSEVYTHAFTALADKEAADEFKSLYNAMVSAMQSA